MDERSGYRALRRGRVSIPDQLYLVTTVTASRHPQLRDFWHARAVIRAMLDLDAEEAVCTLAFVVMPDHVHWLFELGDQPLSRVMQRFKARSARRINDLRHCHAPVWQAGFHDHAVRREENVAMLARYVVMNPVRAGLATEIGAYPFWDCAWEVGDS